MINTALSALAMIFQLRTLVRTGAQRNPFSLSRSAAQSTAESIKRCYNPRLQLFEGGFADLRHVIVEQSRERHDHPDHRHLEFAGQQLRVDLVHVGRPIVELAAEQQQPVGGRECRLDASSACASAVVGEIAATANAARGRLAHRRERAGDVNHAQ